MNIKFAAEVETFGDAIKDVVGDWAKKNRGKSMTRYELKTLLNKITETQDLSGGEKIKAQHDLEKELVEGGILEAFGVNLTSGLHASDGDELCFASSSDALQYLADVTGKKVVIGEPLKK